MAEPAESALDALAMVDVAATEDWAGLALLVEHADLKAVSARLALLGAQLLKELDTDPREWTRDLRAHMIMGDTGG
jgi:hypothetical protein